ncbi:DUF397 domain-containing protein [Streptomyces sp. NPDC057381]|uniref:DUF397 domain-containing protein n=1 Tax=Streptomyces sp. NPDC057381 TaxID=3346111 RepID=UPI0036277A8B
MAEDQGAVVWRKSSYSGADTDNNCCEVAAFPDGIRIRDSKSPDTSVLSFTPGVWTAALEWLSVRSRTTGSDD